MAELASGQTLASRFTLIRHLGSGGMGEAWLARDEDLGTEVVTKIVAPDATADEIALLRQECRSARRLAHPAIVRVFDFHQDARRAFITMEHVDGGDATQLRGRPAAEIVAALLPLVEALEYAHGEGVVHRDLKASNVLVDATGRPHLTDFGIAGVLRPDDGDLRLAGGGSRNHASPQQMAGQPPSPADDIYGLGAFLRDTLELSGPLPNSLRSLLDRMTAAIPAERPADMLEIRAALERFLESEREGRTVAPEVIKSDIRLSPPPRVSELRPPAVPVALVEPRPASPSRHLHRWLTVVAFLILGGVAASVFLVLPKWVEKRSTPGVVENTVTEPVPTAPVAEPQVGVDPEGTVAEPVPIVENLVDEAVAEPGLESEPASAAEVSAPAPSEPRPAVSSETGPRAPKRVDRQAAEFRAAMTDGLRAYEAGELATAKTAFERALELRPESAEAADGLTRTELALRLRAIREYQAAGAAFEARESWRDAERAYDAALALDATLRFARQGKERAAARAVLDEKLEYHSGNPDRLSSDAVLVEAREVLSAARAIAPASDRLQQQIDNLQRAIEVATTPIRVLLVSDNLTQVVVYKVGRLGTFDQRALELRPGTYTVVGTRPGYRDVRRQLRVEAGGESKPLTVRCEERI